MWDKDKLFNKDKPQFKDPTTTNIKPVVIHPKEPEPSLYIPPTRPRQDPPPQQPKMRNRTFWVPPDHSQCTPQWCAYAVGDKAASWDELRAKQKQVYDTHQEDERKRKNPNNYEPYKPAGWKEGER